MSMQREESEDLQASLILQETLETTFDAIDRLPPKYHRIFELSFEQGMSIPEIAKLLDISESGVKRQKRRMLDMLKASLSDESFAMMLCIFQSTAMAWEWGVLRNTSNTSIIYIPAAVLPIWRCHFAMQKVCCLYNVSSSHNEQSNMTWTQKESREMKNLDNEKCWN